MLKTIALTVAATAIFATPALAGTPVMVTINGEVEFNQISTGAYAGVNPGDDAQISFLLDSDLFVDGTLFPTRGYEVDQSSYSYSFAGGSIVTGLADPFPAGQTPYFVLRDNDSAVDGFFLATDPVVGFPNGLPSDQVGIFGDFINQFSVTYDNDPLPSLDILDAVGFYDFTGLTVFGFTIDDGPFNAMGLIFSDMTIEIIPAPATLAVLAPIFFARRRRRA
jgi:hypothetical protein